VTPLGAYRQQEAAQQSGAQLGQYTPQQQQILNRLSELYPALRPYLSRIAIRFSPADQTGRGLEFYQRGESQSFDPSRPAVQVYGNTGASGIAGDIVSHFLGRGVDRGLTNYYNAFRDSLSPQQIDRLRQHQQQEGDTRPFQQWMRMTGVPEAFRGMPFRQWDRGDFAYTPEQRALLTKMMTYVQTRGASPGAPHM
jgi:hypothetical protein